MKIPLFLSCLAVLAATPAAFGAPPSYAPQPIHARFNIRYSWPLGKKAQAAIYKDSMATTDRYDLPESKPVTKGTAAERTVQGDVEGLPFEFYVRLTRTSDADQGLLEVNVIDQQTRQTLPGFPKKIPQALKEMEDDGQITVEMKLTKAENATLLKWLTAHLKEEGTVTKGPITFDQPFLLVGIEKAQ